MSSPGALLQQLSFGAPDWLWCLLLLPAFWLLFLASERRAAKRLYDFAAPRLLPQLRIAFSSSRRSLRFALILVALGLAIFARAKPRFGYTYEDLQRKGLDVLIAIDTSRSMLANDVAPNRLERIKLAVHDLVGELQGDRVGLIAFAGRSFLQAPLTIDYGAALEAVKALDTDVIPEGGSNISQAIALAVQTFGKSATGNRALIVFSDGEEMSGDSRRIADDAAAAGIKIFTVGVGTPEGSLIPLPGQGTATAFVKDRNGEVVKSKLDEKRLREVAEATGGMYLPLGNGPATMRRLYSEGLAQMEAAEIDARLSRSPIERYHWPLGAALLALAASLLINERKRSRNSPGAGQDSTAAPSAAPKRGARAAAASAVLLSMLLLPAAAKAAAPGLEAYQEQRFSEAYQQFQKTLEEHRDSAAADKLHFNSGAAAFKLKEYDKALQSFSQALLSPDAQLQSRSHYNLGNTLYERGESQKATDKKLGDWTNALQHYENTLKLEPENKQAKENLEFVKKKIEELKKEQEQQPSPSPSPNQQKKDDKKQDQQKDQSGQPDQQKPEEGQEQSDQQGEGQNQQPQQGQSPSGSPQSSSPTPPPSPTPSPGDEAGEGPRQTPTPAGQEGEASPSPGENGSPSPSPGEGDESGIDGEGSSPSPAPGSTPTPGKKLSGDVKGAAEDQAQQQQADAGVEAESTKEGEMTEQQALRLLQSMKDEEQRVQLDERRPTRRVYNDW